MNTIECIKSRRSVKKYLDKYVDKETLEKIVDAAKYAPSGRGLQSVKMVVVTNKELRDRLSKLNASILGADIDPFYGAPTVIVVLADKEVPTYVYDGSVTMQTLMLAAHDLGVDSCWIHRAKEEFESSEGKEILRELGIEGHYEGIGHCLLGYIDGDYPTAKERKSDFAIYVE